MGKREELKILTSHHGNPSLSVKRGMSSQLRKPGQILKMKQKMAITLRPQERMAFSVGEPVSSASPPSCTKRIRMDVI
jgi:hypothetical protein